jgi:hypothetical protein
MNTGQNTDAGFLPAHPAMDDIMKRIGGPGWEALNKTPAGADMETARAKAKQDLLRSYAQLAAHPGGAKVLEDILDQTLRRSPYKPGSTLTLEQQTAYGLERMGQNGLATYILKMIHDGQNLPPAGSKKRGKK